MNTFSLSWFSLPMAGCESARALFARARIKPGPGDGFYYVGHWVSPAPGYVGPVPVAVVTGRRRA